MKNLLTSISILIFASVKMLNAQIYADIFTSAGNFTCELNYIDTPKTVANFVTLAEGTRAWLDETNGAVSSVKPPTPFYTGITFHRVINTDGFKIIQAGSKNAQGTDGPGYVFLDEIKDAVPKTYRFDQPYYLAMANSGINTNGSQFFITGNAIPSLEKKHTVFGKVVNGTSTIDAILATPKDTNDRPTTPITIQNVVIRRVGTAATKFKALGQKLPIVTVQKNKLISVASATGLVNRYKFVQPKKSMLHVWLNKEAVTQPAVWQYLGNRWHANPLKIPAFVDVANNSLLPTTSPITSARLVTTRFQSDCFALGDLTKYVLYFINDSGEFAFVFPPLGKGNNAYSYKAINGQTATGFLQKSSNFPVGYSYSCNGYAADITILPENLEPLSIHLGFDKKVGKSIIGRLTTSYWNGNQWVPMTGNTNYALIPL